MRNRWTEACHDHDEWVQLTAAERSLAKYHARKVHELALLSGQQDRGAAPRGGGLVEHERGALGERAVAKWLGVYWPAVIDQQPDESDLPHDIEVRAVSRDNYGLRVYPDDPDGRRCVLVVVENVDADVPYRLPGWLPAEDAKRDEWLTVYRQDPFHVAEQHELRPMRELRQLVVAELVRAEVGWAS